jgi:peptidoglycan/LPS O-acetylase OafA/YrhL
LGQRSYEVYLTHVFVVLGLFHLFTAPNHPMKAVPALFIGAILLAGVSGELVARAYSKPANRWFRKSWGDEPLASVTEPAATSAVNVVST